VHSIAAERERAKFDPRRHAPCSDAAIQPHTHTPAINRVWCSVIFIIITIPGLRLRAAQHTSSPRTRTPEFIYFISAGAAAPPTATGVQNGKRNGSSSTMGTIWMQRAAGYRKWRFVAIYACGEHFQIMQFSCLVENSFTLQCFLKFAWNLFPSREILVFASRYIAERHFLWIAECDSGRLLFTISMRSQ
jgi:hypothetical protein